jgi:hypothetical protein
MMYLASPSLAKVNKFTYKVDMLIVYVEYSKHVFSQLGSHTERSRLSNSRFCGPEPDKLSSGAHFLHRHYSCN